jgi:hypothetical protein
MLYGAIGCTILKKRNKKIIIFSDNHSDINKCDKYIKISEWLNNNKYNHDIFLEEVPRENNEILIELFKNSEHTQDLKNLYLNNKDINGIDIRPKLIPFSLYLNENKSMTYGEYLKDIFDFFKLKNEYLKKNCKLYNIQNISCKKIGYHFILLKNKFNNFIKKYNYLLNKKLIYINNDFNDDFDKIMNYIMEWYVILLLTYSKKDNIIHMGLFHTDNIIYLLNNLYKYKIIHNEGTTKLKFMKNDNNGCINNPLEL